MNPENKKLTAHDFRKIERDGIAYRYYGGISIGTDVRIDERTPDEQKKLLLQHSMNEKLLVTQAVLAKVTYIFEDIRQYDTAGNLKEEVIPLYTRDDDPGAGTVMHYLLQRHKELAKASHPEGRNPNRKVLTIFEDTFEFTPVQAAILLVQTAERVGYTLPDSYLELIAPGSNQDTPQ